MKKILSFMLLLVIVFYSSISLGSTGTTMEVVERNICTIKVNDYANFEKKLISEDMSKKEVTLQLQISNAGRIQTSSADIMLVIDNSSSMRNHTITINETEYTRESVVLSAAKTLINSLFEIDSNINIGVVNFSSNDANEGSLEDAALRTALTNDSSQIINSIDDVATIDAGERTNLEAGLTLGYSELIKGNSNNKYMIVLSDGVPNNAVGGPTLTYSGEVATKTKAKLQEIGNSGVNVISLLTGVSSEIVEPSSNKTYSALAEEIFGTVTNPTTGKYYFITDNEIESTITSNILQDISLPELKLKNITVKDYFPAEIIDNFNFEYVASPNIGKVSAEIDKTTNSISWTIEVLNEGETGTIQYKLLLKDDYSKEIVDKILKTNSKVDIDFTDYEKTDTVTSDVSPTIRVHYEEAPNVEEPKKPEEAPKEFPNAGTTSFILIILITISLALFAGTRYYKINKLSK